MSNTLHNVEPMPLATLVDLVNGWGTTPRLEAGEQDLPYPPRERLAAQLGVPASAEPRSDRAVAAIADRLHPVFASADLGERAALVTELLRASGVRPTVATDGGHVRDGWSVDRRRDAVLAAAAVALRTVIAHESLDRLGTCAGRRCADVYVDASPGRKRSYCSVTCQNRARVAAFRRRRSAAR